MSVVDKALETQVKNIEKKTGKTMDELRQIILESGLTKHGELRDMVKERFELGYGDANTLVHVARQDPNAGEVSIGDAVTQIYSGNKEVLRPLHDKVMARIGKLGDFEIAPKKKYLSLRRKKQFATVGPASKGRIEIGINMKDVAPTDRLEALAPGGMCQYRVYLGEASDVDAELLNWIKFAYEGAG